MKAFRTVIDKGFKEVGINPDGTANRNSGLFLTIGMLSLTMVDWKDIYLLLVIYLIQLDYF